VLASWVKLGWVHKLMGWVGLGWVKKNGPMSISVTDSHSCTTQLGLQTRAEFTKYLTIYHKIIVSP